MRSSTGRADQQSVSAPLEDDEATSDLRGRIQRRVDRLVSGSPFAFAGQPKPANRPVAKRAGRNPNPESDQDLVDNATMHVGQPKVPTGVTVGQPRMVDAHQVQDRRVQVMDIHLVTRD